MQNNSPLWLQLVSISAINIHIHTNIHQFSFIHYILFLAIQSLCTPLCLTAAGWRRYNLWLAGKSADFRTWTPAFLSNFPWKTTWILWNLLYFFLCPSHTHWGGGSAALDHMLHSARSRKCGKKKKVQTLIINQQKCRRIVTPGGKVCEGSDKLESSERIRRVDKCALSLLLFTL